MASSKAIRTSNGFSEIWKEKRGAMRRAAELVIFEKTKTATVWQINGGDNEKTNKRFL